MSDYEKYCTMISSEDILNHKADDIIRSPELIHKESINDLKEKLINTCKNFLEESEKEQIYDLPKREDYLEHYVNRMQYTRKYIYKLYEITSNLNNEYITAGENLVRSKSIIEKLLKENERLNKTINQLKNNEK